MTDTVNVPREVFDVVMAAASEYVVGQYGNTYGLNHPIDRERIWNIIAAAPKAEPSEAARIIACHLPQQECPDTVCIPITITAGDLRRVYSAVYSQTEAPKVEQEPCGYVDPFVLSWMKSGRYTDATIYPTCGKVSNVAIYTHPAPASDELLEALKPFADAAVDLDDGETGHIWERPAAMSIDASDLRRAYELYAKHKGPQS